LNELIKIALLSQKEIETRDQHTNNEFDCLL